MKAIGIRLGFVLSVAMVGACSSKAVDVGGVMDAWPSPRTVYSTAKDVPPNGDSRPWKLADHFLEITGFAVDSGAVFFTGVAHDGSTMFDVGPMLLAECSPEDCAGTRKSIPIPLPSGYSSESTYVAVNEAQIFWTDDRAESPISTEPRMDWSTPVPLGFGQTSYGFAVDATHAFFADRSALLSCTLSDCAGTVTRYAMHSPSGEEVFSSAKSIVLDDSFIYLTDGTRILRVAKEGSDTFEVLARDLQGVGQLAVHEESIFWTESVVLGRVFSCPTTGCDGNPRVLVAGLATPGALAVDDHYVYFAEAPAYETHTDTTPEGASVISRCPVTGCDAPETLVGDDEGVTGSLVVDDNFLYFLGHRCTPGGRESGLEGPCSYLAAMRK